MNIDLRYLALLPPVLLASDFLPPWFLVFTGITLVFLSFFKMPKLLGYLLPFAIYFVFKSVGKQIIPETTIPVLAILLISQMAIERSQAKFSPYLVFLWFGILSLFSVNLYFISYATFIFLLFFINENKIAGEGFFASLKTIYKYKKQLVFTFTLAGFLFVFFPRFSSFLPSANNSIQGRVGYSLNIDNTTTSNLALSSNTAFYAELSKYLPPEQLYWRGRVHSYTDGYNWRSVPPTTTKKASFLNRGEVITSQIKFEQSFGKDVIILDTPLNILKANTRTYSINSTNEKKLYGSNKKIVVTAESSLNTSQEAVSLTSSELKIYLQHPLFTSKKLKDLNQLFENEIGAEAIITSFSNYIIKEKFGYTLSPGPMLTMSNFLEKKRGYCTHFASLLGVILRMNNIPTRLVSGFQGGIFNNVGNYYEIKSNDAHAWVEYFSNGSWKRVDPTAFISPDRIQFGGERFFTTSTQEREQRASNRFATFYQVKQYIDNLNYKVSLFFDNFNKEEQQNLSSFFGLSFTLFLSLGIVLILITVSLFYFLLQRSFPKMLHPIDKYLKKLDYKYKNKKFKFVEQKSINQMKEIILLSKKKTPFKQTSLRIIDEYQRLRYSSQKDESKIQKLFKKLNR